MVPGHKSVPGHELVPGHMFTSFVFKFEYDINGTLILSVDETLIRDGTNFVWADTIFFWAGTNFVGLVPILLGWYQVCRAGTNFVTAPATSIQNYSQVQNWPPMQFSQINWKWLELAGELYSARKKHLRTRCSVWHYCFCIFVFQNFRFSEFLYFCIVSKTIFDQF